MPKHKRQIVTTIPVRLIQSEFEDLVSVMGHFELDEYAKTFIASVSELRYLISENKRLENLIKKLQHEKTIYQEAAFEGFTEEERKQANAYISDST